MARQKKDGMDYFPHDTNANSNIKLEPIVATFGAEGYAFYFLHLEYIYKNKDFELDLNDSETVILICTKLKISEEKYFQILNSCLNRNLFDKKLYEKKKRLSSGGVKERVKPVIQKRKKAQEYKDRQLNNCVVSATEITQQQNSNITEMDIEEKSREKKRKEEKSKVNIEERTDRLTDTTTTENARAKDAWVKMFGAPIPYVEQELADLSTDGDIELICRAIELAAFYNGKNPLAYVKKVLTDCKRDGIQTADEWWKREAERDIAAGRV